MRRMPHGYSHARLSDMRWFLIAVFSLTCLAAPVLATDLEDALQAYHQERYAEAHRGFQMLAAANSAEAAYYLGVMYTMAGVSRVMIRRPQNGIIGPPDRAAILPSTVWA